MSQPAPENTSASSTTSRFHAMLDEFVVKCRETFGSFSADFHDLVEKLHTQGHTDVHQMSSEGLPPESAAPSTAEAAGTDSPVS